MKHYEEVLKILHDQLGWKLYDSLSDKGRELVADTIKAIDIAKNDRDVRQTKVSGWTRLLAIFRGKNKNLQQTSVNGCTSFEQGFPDENETVWLYNRNNNFAALGCHVWMGEDDGWFWALSNGTIYVENGKIVSECEIDDDYEFTHWSRLPTFPS